MSKKNEVILEKVRLGKFVHGGQTMAKLPDGKVIFVWGGLPSELVDVRVTKKKRSHLEGIVTLVHESSTDRIEPEEPHSYLSTSPWQIVEWKAENKAKQEILEETFKREGLANIAFSTFVANASGRVGQGLIHSSSGETSSPEGVYRYRNKMEFGFWGDDDGLHLAHYVRGTHGKQVVQGSILTTKHVNNAANSILTELQSLGLWGGDLKTVLLREGEAGQVAAALFVKNLDIDFSPLKLPAGLQGLVIYYSDPLSPASVPTKKTYTLGDINVSNTIRGKNIVYDVMSFFQVNIPIFEVALDVINDEVEKSRSKSPGVQVVDMYSGVGTIGIAMSADVLVESEKVNIQKAKQNTAATKVTVIHATSEKALEYINNEQVLIVDPPRAGLHRVVVDRILDQLPEKVIYLSCNPSTQARDVKHLSEKYSISYAQGYNFFPRTPHIESLVVLILI